MSEDDRVLALVAAWRASAAKLLERSAPALIVKVGTPWHPGSVFDGTYASVDNVIEPAVQIPEMPEWLKRAEEDAVQRRRDRVFRGPVDSMIVDDPFKETDAVFIERMNEIYYRSEALSQSDIAQRLGISIHDISEPPMKVYKARNVEVLIGGKPLLVGQWDEPPMRDPSAKPAIYEAKFEAKTTANILGVLKQAIDNHHDSASWLNPLTARGSWFAWPTNQRPLKIHENVEREKRAKFAQERMLKPLTSYTVDQMYEDWRADIGQRLLDARNRVLSDPRPENVKKVGFIQALDVVCMHCGEAEHFAAVVEEYPEDLLCLSCKQALWPNGGFAEVMLATSLTGDFVAMQAMLMNPPEKEDE